MRGSWTDRLEGRRYDTKRDRIMEATGRWSLLIVTLLAI